MSAVMALTGCEMLNHHDGDRTAGRTLDDKTITATVKHDLNREPVYKFDGVDVKTYDGVVQLSGFVDTDQQKHRAEDVAKQAEGVTQVVNNITLKPEGNNMAPTGQPNGYDHNYNNNNNGNPR
ncbi:MAG TPA: BON domain-containing protein [Verrucomicrobiae bacterium]|jgi:osmotically-inducible protein OsmY|nr:BON domain-containing protein [Verrucomicrobiae bacterium]